MKKSFYISILLMSIFLFAGCQTSGKKGVKLTEENWADYLELTTDINRDLNSKNYVVKFCIKSKKEDYIFNDVEGTIKYFYDIYDNWGEVADFGDNETGEIWNGLNQTGSDGFQLDRYGNFYIETELKNEDLRITYYYFTSDDFIAFFRIENFKPILKFKSGTVSKKELE